MNARLSCDQHNMIALQTAQKLIQECPDEASRLIIAESILVGVIGSISRGEPMQSVVCLELVYKGAKERLINWRPYAEPTALEG